jgi:FkbM family methyltransferase
VDLSVGDPVDAGLIIPEIRSAVRDGTYSAEVIHQLPDMVRSGDRVLVIGAGLGIVSTLIAKRMGVARVIATEPDIRLIPHLKKVHALNGVPWVETINAVLDCESKGRVPFFARRDLRDSSPVPNGGPWECAMMVPCVDMDLVLTEEQISLVVCEAPISPALLRTCAEHQSVERILVDSNIDNASEHCRDGAGADRAANCSQKPINTTISNQ